MTADLVLILQSHDGLVIWPRDHVALLREEEGTGRLEATSVDGEVAHRPGRIADFEGAPWVKLDNATLVHPRHAKRRGHTLALPGDWRIPHRGRLHRGSSILYLRVEDADLDARDVLYLQSRSYRATWVTDHGEVPAGRIARTIAAAHPSLLRAGRVYLNALRLRAVVKPGTYYVAILDTGARIHLSQRAAEGLRSSLGLESLRHLSPDPAQRILYDEGLRDWPVSLAEASRDQLRAWFEDDERRLMANVIWQVIRHRRLGLPTRAGTYHRGFWYWPMLPVLVRAGMARDVPPDQIVTLATGLEDPQYRRMVILMGDLVGLSLFTYEALGFTDPRPDYRRIGTRRPHIVILAEKSTVEPLLWALCEHYGVSGLILGAYPSLLITEWFVKALLAHLDGRPVIVIAYVDFDYSGWIIAEAFCDQLRLYGLEVTHLGYLVRPSRFTPAELKKLAVPLPARSKSIAGRITAWIKKSGGINGKPLGLHSDHLRDLTRLYAAFEEEMAKA